MKEIGNAPIPNAVIRISLGVNSVIGVMKTNLPMPAQVVVIQVWDIILINIESLVVYSQLRFETRKQNTVCKS